MEFNSEHKVNIETMNEAEKSTFAKFLESEILRHEDDIKGAKELIEKVKETSRPPPTLREEITLALASNCVYKNDWTCKCDADSAGECYKSLLDAIMAILKRRCQGKSTYDKWAIIRMIGDADCSQCTKDKHISV